MNFLRRVVGRTALPEITTLGRAGGMPMASTLVAGKTRHAANARASMVGQCPALARTIRRVVGMPGCWNAFNPSHNAGRRSPRKESNALPGRRPRVTPNACFFLNQNLKFAN